MATIKDIAKLAGVTYVTVSRALNNEPGVSEKTRKKIRDIADQLEYVPNLAAKRLVDRSSNGIGLIWPDREEPFFYRLCNEVQQEASRRGYTVMVSLAEQEEALRSFQHFFIDRVIYWVYKRPSSGFLKAKEAFRGTIVEVGGWKQEYAHRIDIDRKGALRKAVQHLVELGHSRIAFIGAHTDKWLGFTEAQVQFQLEYMPELVVMTTIWEPDCTQKLELFFDSFRELGATAAVIDSQGLFYKAVQAMNGKNVRIPEDLSLVVYDDLPEIQSVLPVSVTTVGPDLSVLARTMIDMATVKAEKNGNEVLQRETVPTELTWRASTSSLQ